MTNKTTVKAVFYFAARESKWMPKSTQIGIHHEAYNYHQTIVTLVNISKPPTMNKEKWVNTLIFETALFDYSKLSDVENVIIRKYLQDKKKPEQIAKMCKVPVDEVNKIIKTGMEKILLSSKEVLATKIWFRDMVAEKENLQKELAAIKERFKNQLADDGLTAEYERLSIPVTNLFISTRAKTVFRGLKIKTLNDLAGLTLKRLKNARDAGPVAINEIVRKALEFGITIT